MGMIHLAKVSDLSHGEIVTETSKAVASLIHSLLNLDHVHSKAQKPGKGSIVRFGPSLDQKAQKYIPINAADSTNPTRY